MAGQGATLKRFGSYLLLATAVSSLTVRVAHAGDVTVSSARTTPASTAAGDGNGPGNIVVETAGSIAVSEPTAVTLNSDHGVTTRGPISTTAESNATGILVDASANRTGVVDNYAAVTIPGPGENSSLLNSIVSNAGIRLSGPGTFTGSITNNAGGIITVGGNGSSGVLIGSTMVGNVANHGVIDIVGADSYGIQTTGRIFGAVTSGGAISSIGTNGVGVYLGGGVDGAYIHSGAIIAGNPERLYSPDGVRIERTVPIPARAGIWIASNIGEGFQVTGNRYTIAQQQVDADAAVATPVDATVETYGPGPAVHITQGGPAGALADITIGRRPDTDYAFINQGILTSSGAIAGTNAVTVNIEGLSSGGAAYTTTLEGGFWNDGGDINAISLDAAATGVRIGDLGIVPTVNNAGDITVATTDSTTNTATGAVGNLGGSAYGIVIEQAGRVDTLLNSGRITVTSDGLSSGSYGIIDRSGTVAAFVNSGQITTVLAAGSTGPATAIDFSANAIGTTFTNSGTITGNVLLGGGHQALSTTADSTITGSVAFQSGAAKTGTSVVNMNGGTITGRIDLGNGDHAVTLAGASALGGFTQGTGTLSTFAAASSEFSLLSAGPLRTQAAAFTGETRVNFDISGPTDTALLRVDGLATISTDTRLYTTITGILEGRQVYTLIDAGTLAIDATLDEITSVPVSFMNDIEFALSPSDPNLLQLTVERKSAEALGLGPNMTAVYDSFAAALNQDTAVATALSGLATQADFVSGLRQLMPDSSGAILQTAINSQDMNAGLIRRRMLGVARGGAPDHARGDVASFWVQALGNYGDQSARGEQAGFSYWGLGIALGADFPVSRSGNTTLGVSFVESWHSVSLNVAAHSPVQFYSTQLSAYTHHQAGNLYIQGTAGGAYNTYDQERGVTFGGLDRHAIGKWSGYQYSGTLEAGYLVRRGLYELGPYARVAYLKIHENGYTETGGGTGVNLAIDDRNGESFRGTAGFVLNRNFLLSYDSYVEAQFRGGFTREFMGDPVAVTARFVSGGPAFTNLGNAWSKNRIATGIGIAHKDSYSSVSLDYDAEVASGFLSHTAAVTVRFRF